MPLQLMFWVMLLVLMLPGGASGQRTLPEGKGATALPEIVKRGSGPVTLLLVPCMSCRWKAFEPFMNRNLDRYTMYAVTLPGMGGTPVPSIPENTAGTPWHDQAVAALSRLLDDEHMHDVVIVGHSFGSAMALRLAAKRPDVVRRFVNIDGFITSSRSWFPERPADRLFEADKVITDNTPRLAEPDYWQRFNSVTMTDPQRAMLYHGWFMATDRRVVLQYWRENLLDDLNVALKSVTVPFLDIKAIGRMVTNPDSVIRRHRDDLKASGAGTNVRTVFFHQTRHHVLEDRPVELDAAISDFLAERELRDFRPVPEGAAASTSPLIDGLLAPAVVTPTVAAQRPTLANAVRPFVAVDTSAVALTHVRVIDGTGAAPKTDQTIIIRDGRIASIGNSAATQVPAGMLIMDLTGKSVIPGLVMVHEHLHYPTGPGVYGNVTESFSRLYLAGGVTSMRTAGSVNGIADLRLKKAIDAGARAGPWMDATAPYLEGSPGLNLNQFYELRNAADARRHIEYWAGLGATSLKAFSHITRDELRAALDDGHKRGLKVTGHLCSITYREAADLGIDNLEHGFFAATDFVANKQPDVCPDQTVALRALAAVDPAGEAMRSLIRDLIDRKVALTSTLPVLETFTPGRPVPPGLDVLDPILRDQFLRSKAAIDRDATSIFATLYSKLAKLDVDFFRAGGLLLTGTDPTGIGGVIAGYSNQRALELLVEAGLTPLEAIKVGTLNGATFLGRGALVGSIAAGKQADLVVIDGDPSTRIDDVRKVTLVFKQGVGYDPEKLIASVRGRVGLF